MTIREHILAALGPENDHPAAFEIDRTMHDGWACLLYGEKVHYAVAGKTLCGRPVDWSEVFTVPEVYGPVTCAGCMTRLPEDARAAEQQMEFRALPWYRRAWWLLWH